MPVDIVTVKTLHGYRLQLGFEDGSKGIVEVRKLVALTGIFAPLDDEEFFRKVTVNAELGTVVWPNGSDLDPDVLHGLVLGNPLETQRDRAS